MRRSKSSGSHSLSGLQPGARSLTWPRGTKSSRPDCDGNGRSARARTRRALGTVGSAGCTATGTRALTWSGVRIVSRAACCLSITRARRPRYGMRTRSVSAGPDLRLRARVFKRLPYAGAAAQRLDGAHRRAFESSGAVPAMVVCGNLRGAVRKALRCDPDLNPAYGDLAARCEIIVPLARIRRPRDKWQAGACEQSV